MKKIICFPLAFFYSIACFGTNNSEAVTEKDRANLTSLTGTFVLYKGNRVKCKDIITVYHYPDRFGIFAKSHIVKESKNGRKIETMSSSGNILSLDIPSSSFSSDIDQEYFKKFVSIEKNFLMISTDDSERPWEIGTLMRNMDISFKVKPFKYYTKAELVFHKNDVLFSSSNKKCHYIRENSDEEIETFN